MTLVRVLNEKLREAHTQYLAKNPMQLTILLSLINNRGASLPEKRTAMYDSYMDMFFSRESEKSDVVRDNRDLLIDIHRYLAWKLQTGAEGGENGSIEHSALRTLLFSYLDSQGEDTGIVSALFDGIIERVGALVSRVQETYEFEVQPLREYFAARHLYETAPYSAESDDGGGTKLDRFQALVRNPYWLNVARFYGGCFSKGEVSALVDELGQLATSADYGPTSHPRVVALMFLADWVFTQYQPAVRRIVDLICTPPQLRQLLAAEQAGTLNWSPLPDRSGRAEFVERLWSLFVFSERSDEQLGLAAAIIENSPPGERFTRWTSVRGDLDEEAWITKGVMLGLFRALPHAALSTFTGAVPASAIGGFLSAKQFDLLENRPEAKRTAANDMLAGCFIPRMMIRDDTASPGELYWMAAILGPQQYGVAVSDNSGVPLQIVIERRHGFDGRLRHPGRASDQLVTSHHFRCAIAAYDKFLGTPTDITASTTKPWSELVEALRGAWGDCLAIDRIACFAAGVRARDEAGSDQPLGSTSDLVGSARFARLKSGAPRWWSSALEAAPNTDELVRLLLLLWVWATPRTILAIIDVIDSRLQALDSFAWARLHANYNFSTDYGSRGYVDTLSKKEFKQLNGYSARTVMLVGSRMSADIRHDCVAAILGDDKAGTAELQFAMNAIVHTCRKNKRWKSELTAIENLYARGAIAHSVPGREDLGVDADSAVRISSSLESYPLAMVAAADSRLKARVGERSSKLLDVANQERWFTAMYGT